MKVYRGEVYYCDLGESKGSVQKGVRPVVVVQNNWGNSVSSTVIVAPVTSKVDNLPTHVTIKLNSSSVIMTEQLVTVPKSELQGNPVYYLTSKEITLLDYALAVSIGL